MLFGKKKQKRSGGMIDVGELQRRGKILGPDKEIPRMNVDTEGYAHFGSSDESSKKPSTIRKISKKEIEEMTTSRNTFSTEAIGYTKKEVDSKIQEIDKLIYKLEQRIEVLEKKSGIDSGYSNTNNAISW